MKRILQISMTKIIGGIESFQRNLFSHIDRAEYPFDFVTTYQDAALIPTVEALGGRVHHLPPQKTVIPYCIALYRLLKRENYHAVHIHKNSCANPMAIFVSRLAGVKQIIVHSHSTAAIGGRHLHIFHYLFRPLVRRIATVRLACSQEAGRWLFGKNCDFTVIKNGIDTVRFSYNDENRRKYREELNLEGKLVIGHVGNFIHAKNHGFMIEIMAEVLKKQPDAVLMLVGRGDGRPAIEAYARQKGIADQVIFMGARNDVAELYSAMDVFLFPSLFEGLPIAGVEAQCADLPCLFSEGVSLQTILTDKAQRIPLDKGAAYWAEKVLECKDGSRGDVTEVLWEKGFDAGITAAFMEKVYG